MNNYDELIKITGDFTKTKVKPSRYEHSIRVAQMCEDLCLKFGIEGKKGYLVGISHDMCKDFPHDQMLELAKEDGMVITDFELKRPDLLHGRAAAVMLKKQFEINDKDILQAVAVHTSGCMGLCDLAKILFVADKIEPGRPQSTDEYRNRLLNLSLDELFYTVLYENYEYVTKKGYELYPETKKMVEYYKSVLN